MTATILGGILLAVAFISLTIYVIALERLLLAGSRRPGLVRTATCRVIGAILYVGVALATILAPDTGPVVGLGVFVIVQLIWQGNAIADVRLGHRTDGT